MPPRFRRCCATDGWGAKFLPINANPSLRIWPIFTRSTSIRCWSLSPPPHPSARPCAARLYLAPDCRTGPEIEAVAAQLLADLPQRPFDLIPAFCTQLPVRIIARLLGVPEAMWPDLLRWSNAMVAMYQVGRTRAVEDAANQAAADFSDFLRGYVDQRRTTRAMI